MKKLTQKEINLINKVLDELQSFCFNTTNLIDDLSTNESEEEQMKCQEYIINQLKTITNNMTTSEKAVEVLKTKYNIQAECYDNKVYLAVWNDDLSDTIDVEASKEQVEDWASEYEEK